MSGAFWSKPLWDSDSDNDGESDGWFSAPSVMSIAKIAVSVAGGGPWMSFALDALDTAANVAMGNMSLKDGVTGLGKSAATTAIASSGFAQGFGNGLGDVVADAGLGSVTASVVSSVASSYVGSYVNGWVNSVEFDGGFHFNADTLKGSMKNAWKGAAISGVSSLVSSSIMSSKGASWAHGRMGFNDGGGVGYHNNIASQDLVQSTTKLSSFVGGLAGQVANYAINQQFSLSFLNSGFLMDALGIEDPGSWKTVENPDGTTSEIRVGDQFQQQNLLSMTFGKGPLFELGSNGLDISHGSLMDLSSSLTYFNNEYQHDVGAQALKNLSGSREGQAQLAMMNRRFLAQGGNDKIGLDLLHGRKDMVFDQVHEKDRKHYGHADPVTGTIHLNKEALDLSSQQNIWGYSTVTGREGLSIDLNRALGVAGKSDDFMRTSGYGAAITYAITAAQSREMNQIANTFGIDFDGEWGDMKAVVDYAARTGDLTGFDPTGRDFWYRVNKGETLPKIAHDFMITPKSGEKGLQWYMFLMNNALLFKSKNNREFDLNAIKPGDQIWIEDQPVYDKVAVYLNGDKSFSKGWLGEILRLPMDVTLEGGVKLLEAVIGPKAPVASYLLHRSMKNDAEDRDMVITDHDQSHQFIYDSVHNNQAFRNFISRSYQRHGFQENRMAEDDYRYRFDAANGNDLHLAFNNVSFIRPRVDNGYLTITMIDRYDFQFSESLKASGAAALSAIGTMNEYYIVMRLRYKIADLLRKQ